MNKINYSTCLLLIAMFVSSCVSSLYPISDNEQDLIFRDELLGQWSDKDMQHVIVLNKWGSKRYKVTAIDKKTCELGGKQISALDTSYFLGFLIQLGDQYFFDCYADTDHPTFKCLGKESRSSILPLHFIYKIQFLANNQLSVAGINIDAMRNFIDKNRNTVKHELVNKDHILLTADATGLQKNMLTNKQANVFTDADTLTRIK